MKFPRCIILFVSVLIPLLLFTRCGDTPYAVKPLPSSSLDKMSLYEAFQKQFDSGKSLLNFYDSDSGKYKVAFSDGRVRTIDANDVRVFVCRPFSWPAIVPGKDEVWYVNGGDTGIAVVPEGGEEQVVAVIYDVEGLYVRLSSGRMFFFHYGKVLDIGCFRFEMALNPSLSADIVCSSSYGVITGSFGKNDASYQLVATIGYRGYGFTYEGQAVQGSISVIDYSGEKTFDLQKDTGSIPYKVKIAETRQIPVLWISTGGTAINKEFYMAATMRIDDPDLLYGKVESETVSMEIKGRGNTTWGAPKKPFKIKLDEKKRLLGMSEDKHWVLLANYSDKTLLRNVAAFEISRLLDMAWVPRTRPVELYLNGSYEGQYMLTEHIRVSPERADIDIVGPDDNSGTAVTGGYFLSIDQRHSEPRWFDTAKGLSVCFLEPEYPTDAQYEWLKKYCQDAEDVLHGSGFADPQTGYRAWIDVRSFIQNFLVQEITKNVDGNMRLSTYMWKPYQGKLGFPCVWDFDRALGNCDYIDTSPEGWHIRNSRWYQRLFDDPVFKSELREMWRELYPRLPQVETTVRQWAGLMTEARKRNFTKWQILGVHVDPNVNAIQKTTYEAELEDMLDYFNKRIVWMNSRIEGWEL